MKRLIKCINRLVLSIFYKIDYLRGKHFEDSFVGFIWAWRGIGRSFKLRARGIRFPVGKNTRISNGRNLKFDVSSMNVFQQPGCFFQNYEAKITIGKDVHIAANVGIITQNHNPQNPDEHLPAEPVVIGDHCWIGMNAVILPGVVLGDHTTVGAGAVVTHSFEGNCVVAGNPARVIKTFEKKS
ncbi:MAG: acyltransferase [Clostridia bacterium]|nr:acyltransferase [Clostridia bacterium]